MSKAPNPITCTVCSAELAFIRHDSKLGKDGRVARWAVYEKCTNPDCKVGRRNTGAPEPTVNSKILTPTQDEPDKIGRMFQWRDLSHLRIVTLSRLEDCPQHLLDLPPCPVHTLHLHPDDCPVVDPDGTGFLLLGNQHIRIQADPTLTKGYQYAWITIPFSAF